MYTIYPFARKEFDDIFNRYYSVLCVYAQDKLSLRSQDEASDIVINVFVKIWEKKITFESLNHCKAFLYRSTLNACIDVMRVERTKNINEANYVESILANGSSFLDDILKYEVWNEIYAAIKQLPRQCETIITLAFLERMSNEEIAQELNLSIQSVKNTKSRGLEKLRKILNKNIFNIFINFL